MAYWISDGKLKKSKERDPLWKQSRKNKRSIANKRLRHDKTTENTRKNPAYRASDWLLPWEIDAYPGKSHGLAEILGNNWKYSTIKIWFSCPHKMPDIARRMLAAEIRSRCHDGLAIADALEEAIRSRPRAVPKQNNFCKKMTSD